MLGAEALASRTTKLPGPPGVFCPYSWRVNIRISIYSKLYLLECPLSILCACGWRLDTVEDVMARYVWTVDSLDAEGYVAVFTEDAVIDSNGSVSKI